MSPRKLFVCVGLVIQIFVSINSASATQLDVGGGAAYFDWSGALLSADSSITQGIQPLEISPLTYWEEGWAWDNGKDGGYGGIQAQGNLADGRKSDLAIFSVWNAVMAIAGDGSGCTPFGGEGVGYSCRRPISLVKGNIYHLNFAMDTSRGTNWWMASISDLARGTTDVIGYIEVKDFNLYARNWNNFIEYWGPHIPCNSIGPATAKFFAPTATGKDVEITFARFSVQDPSCVNAAADTPPSGAIGDAVMRFGGAFQGPSTEGMPYQLTKQQLALQQAAADKAAADKAAADKAAADKAAADKAAAEKRVTIRCKKGQVIKKVTSLSPKCPAGYKKA